ncbi:MAG: PQQ-dependent sugar dehydrogenase [Actinomycetota bacterium]|nr:PQQ-dependent sugar dehydrogenase [Actinomycetota bacterium]
MLTAGALLAPAVPAAAAPTLRAKSVQGGLVNPWDVAFARGQRMLVTERPGRIRVFTGSGPRARLLHTTRVPRIRARGEAGLMGIAVDRSRHPRVFVCASRGVRGRWVNQVLRYNLGDDHRLRFEGYVIRSRMRANSIHNGCAVEMGPDGKVWVSMGDAGRAAAAQNPRSLNGKILRAEKSGRVPRHNPVLPGARRRSYAWSMGHRNRQGIAFKPGTLGVFAVEHGPDRDDEVNLIRKRGNYGWPCYTGRGHRYAGVPGGCRRVRGYRNPVWASGFPTLATSGGSFTRGRRWDAYRGDLLVSTLKESDVRRLRPRRRGRRMSPQARVLLNRRFGRLRAATRAPGGNLMLTTSNGTNDRVVRVVPHR